MSLAHLSYNTTISVFIKCYCTLQCRYSKADTVEQGCGERTVTPFRKSFCLTPRTPSLHGAGGVFVLNKRIKDQLLLLKPSGTERLIPTLPRHSSSSRTGVCATVHNVLWPLPWPGHPRDNYPCSPGNFFQGKKGQQCRWSGVQCSRSIYEHLSLTCQWPFLSPAQHTHSPLPRHSPTGPVHVGKGLGCGLDCDCLCLRIYEA